MHTSHDKHNMQFTLDIILYIKNHTEIFIIKIVKKVHFSLC